MAAPDSTLEPSVQQDIGLGDLARQHHRIMQRQGMAQRPKAQPTGPLGQAAKQRQRIGINGELLKKRMFKNREEIESTLVGVLAESDHVVDQLRVVSARRALNLGVGPKTQGWGHRNSL